MNLQDRYVLQVSAFSPIVQAGLHNFKHPYVGIYRHYSSNTSTQVPAFRLGIDIVAQFRIVIHMFYRIIERDLLLIAVRSEYLGSALSPQVGRLSSDCGPMRA